MSRTARDTTVCHLHGGKSDGILQARTARRVYERQTVALAALGLTADDWVDPAVALMDELARACREVEYWGNLIGTDLGVPDVMAPNPFMDPVGMAEDGNPVYRRTVSSVYGVAGADNELGLHVMVTAWHMARDRKVKVAKLCIDAGLAERQVRATEQVAAAVVDATLALINDPALGLHPEQRDLARTLAAKHLRAIEATTAVAAAT